MFQTITRRNLVKYGLAILGALSLGLWRGPVPFLDGPQEASAKRSPSSGKSGSSSRQRGSLFGYKGNVP